MMQTLQISLGPTRKMPDPGIPNYRYCPDGHVSYLKDGEEFQMFWASDTSYRTTGVDPFHMYDPIAVLKGGDKGEFDNGGAWLYSVFRQNDSRLIGFYHAEDREFAGDPSSHFIAWKSVASCISDDNGRTWSKRGQIIHTARRKPMQPTWGGNGDFCVVRDTRNERWICFYQEGVLCMAASSDPEGKPGTWKKYFDGDFKEPGLGGENSPIPGLAHCRGGNPSVHFNSLLNQWVMVWHTWDRVPVHPASLMISTSDDLVQWNAPQVLLQSQAPERFWYPTIIGTSDVEAGQTALLLYAYFPNMSKHEREFVVREISFTI